MMIATNKQLGKQRGIGLLELMLALAIIAILLIMATRYYQSTSQAQKVNQAASDIQAILAGFSNYRAGDPTGSFDQDDLTPFVPQSISDSWDTSNPWGGEYTAVNGGQTTSIIIGLTGMPANACDALTSLETQNVLAGKATTSKCSTGEFSGEFGISNDKTK